MMTDNKSLNFLYLSLCNTKNNTITLKEEVIQFHSILRMNFAADFSIGKNFAFVFSFSCLFLS